MSNSMKKSVYNLDVKLTGLETTWRPDGDMSLRSRRDVSWRLRGSRWNRGDIKLVRLKKKLFGDFSKSPVDIVDVAATSNRLTVSSSLGRRLRDCWGLFHQSDLSLSRLKRAK